MDPHDENLSVAIWLIVCSSSGQATIPAEEHAHISPFLTLCFDAPMTALGVTIQKQHEKTLKFLLERDDFSAFTAIISISKNN